MFKDEKYLGAYSLEVNGKYQPVVVTIEKVYEGKFQSQGGDEIRPFIKLAEFDKPMVVNRTNFKRLETFFKSFDINDFVGKQIVLGVENVKSPEGIVAALRFSTRPLPEPEKVILPALTEVELTSAVEKIKAGKSSIEKIERSRAITPEQRAKIEELCKV
jgi:hypothetical protein